jgi:transposase InsO family protein
LPLLKFESNLVCALCHHEKMIAAFHSLVNTVMTYQPGQLLHIDSVSPSQVHSMGGKWYILVIVDDYSRYSWVFYLESKDEVFKHFQRLALSLNNEHSNYLKAIHSDNGTEFRNASFNQFCLEHGVDQQFRKICQNSNLKNCRIFKNSNVKFEKSPNFKVEKSHSQQKHLLGCFQN